MTDMNAIVDIASLRDAISENQGRPAGSARVVAAEEIAERAGTISEEAHVEALVHLVGAHYHTDEPDRMLVPFATLVQRWDENPEWFDEWDTYSFFWAFKWATTDMLKIPGVPLQAIEDWLVQMEIRYRAAGHTLRAPRAYELAVASHIGDRERAQRAFDSWLAAERDKMSDCQACEVGDEGDWHLRCGDDHAALHAWAPVLDGELTCSEEPHRVIAKSLLPLVRAGRIDEARANHLRGYPMVRDSENLIRSAMHHIEFCALTGNEARAVELLAERPARFEATAADTRMHVFTTTAVLMQRLVTLRRGDLTVPGPRGRSWTARELSAHARSEALRIAALFDERNRTSAVGDSVRASLGTTTPVADLRLGLRSIFLDDDAARGRSGPSNATTRAEADADRATHDAPRTNSVPDQAMDALRRFEEAAAEGDTNQMRATLSEALDHGAEQAPPDWRAAVHLNLSAVLHQADELAEATHHALEGVALADLDSAPFAAAARCRLAGLLLQQQRPTEAAPVLEQAIVDLDVTEHGEGMVAQAHRWLGDCHSERGEHGDAAREYLAAARIAEGWDDQESYARLAHLAADALSNAGHLAEATAAYRKATGLWEQAGEADMQVRSLRAHAWLLRRDDVESASRLMLDATHVCEQAETGLGPDVLAETLVQHARLVTDDDTPDGRCQGLFPGALDLATSLADRAEILSRTARDDDEQSATALAQWARAALLAAELALVAGEAERSLILVRDVEDAHPETHEDAWPRPYCRWIRSEAAAG